MKKTLFFIIFAFIPLILTGCNYDNTQTLNNKSTIINDNKTTKTTIFNAINQDMANVTSTLRNLDVLNYEDYAILELNPIMEYSTYQNQFDNYGLNANNSQLNNELPASTYDYKEFEANYSYIPKYILDTSILDTSFLQSYIQSLQDLFLITNDITAGNQILNNQIYNTINEALNIRNITKQPTLALINLTQEQYAIFNECSIGINALLTNITNCSGFIDAELSSLSPLRDNYYKNVEALNIKYITILNIIDNRIVQLQNLELLIQRLNNQLLILLTPSNNNLQNNNNFNNDFINQNNNFNNENNIINNKTKEQIIENNQSNNNTINNIDLENNENDNNILLEENNKLNYDSYINNNTLNSKNNEL